jgi:hypothetical protein
MNGRLVRSSLFNTLRIFCIINDSVLLAKKKEKTKKNKKEEEEEEKKKKRAPLWMYRRAYQFIGAIKNDRQLVLNI